MKYTFDDIELFSRPRSFNNTTKKEILQYAVSGLLYMPATKTKIIDDILTQKHPEFKSICLDLEDSIGDDTVLQAEENVTIILRTLSEACANETLSNDDIPLIFIRVREPKQVERIFENAGKYFDVLTGFNFPKFDKTNAKEYLNSFDTVQKQSKKILYFMPILESKNVMNIKTRLNELNQIYQLCSNYSENVLNIRVGATDFCNLYGLRRNINQTIYDIRVVSECFSDIMNIFGESFVVSGPVWEYFDSKGTPGKWSEGLEKELALDKVNGFIGKTCIHPSQLSYITKSNIVSYENYQDAINILGMNKGIIGVSKGHGNNKMNEVKTHFNWARKIMCLAEIYGVMKPETNE